MSYVLCVMQESVLRPLLYFSVWECQVSNTEHRDNTHKIREPGRMTCPKKETALTYLSLSMTHARERERQIKC